ncbi:POU domain, class 2, transcription factor 1, isoform CRA_d [Rattus norvegicus]|uniref:POU domain, class 2, transcription factor 1, isoform CRA_d n=1 Tax=Rattus norvegicus TaxID=10116 RepID=A6IDJ3_RAT|nr:POU domain, class 2, transcription factor 1, isoform CRA_d [Rattus norvegicus]
MLDCSDCVLDSRMNNPSETNKSSMESGDASTAVARSREVIIAEL